MAAKKTSKQQGKPWLIPALVLSVFAVLIGYFLKTVLSDSGSKAPKQIQVITLIKPPPDVKEKLPEPEVPKEAPKQTIEAPSEAPTPQDSAQDSADDSPTWVRLNSKKSTCKCERDVTTGAIDVCHRRVAEDRR